MRIVIGDELTVLMTLTGRTGCHADAEGKCLLQDEHEHGGQDARAVATRGVEHRHVVNGQGLCGDDILAFGIITRLLDVDACAEPR